MDETKPWYQSTGVIGALIAVGATLAGAFGWTIDAETQKAMTADVGAIVTAAVAVAGGVLALVGRIRATRRVAAGK